MSLLFDPGGISRHRSGGFSSNIGVVGTVRDPGDELPSDEDGTNEREVVEMCPSLIWIVDRELGPRFDIGSEPIEHRGD